ncbi:MAG TPA: radical SAM protein [bacterium]|nr:radical SAM protein [bacterium]HOL35651.1 radical SAM protein [bacterium]HPP09029.1 radical SAM protein [bacterium]
MKEKNFRYIYGPVSSWRLGASLGIDQLSQEKKICSFDCVYCQIGRTGVFTCERKIYVPAEAVIEELKQLPEVEIDYYTFSGRGEPTLAKDFKKLATWIKNEKRGRCAILTNSTTITDPSVRDDLCVMDLVSFKIDAATQETFEKINRPCCGITLDTILNHLADFRKIYQGLFTIQVMAIEENLKEMSQIAEICRKLSPDIVYLNTPLRDSSVPPVSQQHFNELEKLFEGLRVLSVYSAHKKVVQPISVKDTMKRRGKKI